MDSVSLRRVLHQLARAGRSGALYVGGSPGGVLFLLAGQIVHAESPACPGVGARLVSSGRLAAGAWRAAYAEGSLDCRVGPILIRDGHLGRNELAGRVASAVREATRAVLRSDGATVRFVDGERHWLGIIPADPGPRQRIRAAVGQAS
ncbi:DUF4388 domain-containing protein [Actinoplanes sp. NPDC049265]|uniref:DUF4388 domain-containing protein n=1 Tax=Actinoplanes sp. NPDC049265 TaxID=3363902 RepID=UPI003719984B